MEEKKKKKTTTKSTTKKEVKKVEKEEKNAVPDDEPFSIKFKSFIASYKFLYTAFGILFAIVIILGCMVYVRTGEEPKHKSDIVFSIMESNTQNYLDLDLQTLVGKEYTLKVTNFRNNKINSEETPYKIVITNNSEAEIEILKNDAGQNLMTDQTTTTIEGEKFSTTKEESVVYYFRIKGEDKIKKGDTMRIEVDS